MKPGKYLPENDNNNSREDIEYFLAFEELGKAKGLKEGIDNARIKKFDELDNFLPFLTTARAERVWDNWQENFPAIKEPEVREKLEELSRLASKVHGRMVLEGPEEKTHREEARLAAQKMISLLEDERVHRVVEEAVRYWRKN